VCISLVYQFEILRIRIAVGIRASPPVRLRNATSTDPVFKQVNRTYTRLPTTTEIASGGFWVSSETPTLMPSQAPTHTPTLHPSGYPTQTPSHAPTLSPSDYPTQTPSHTPTLTPSGYPNSATAVVTDSLNISVHTPPIRLTFVPSQLPSDWPTSVPSQVPSDWPTFVPSQVPSAWPTFMPTPIPTPSTAVGLYPITDPPISPRPSEFCMDFLSEAAIDQLYIVPPSLVTENRILASTDWNEPLSLITGYRWFPSPTGASCSFLAPAHPCVCLLAYAATATADRSCPFLLMFIASVTASFVVPVQHQIPFGACGPHAEVNRVLPRWRKSVDPVTPGSLE